MYDLRYPPTQNPDPNPAPNYRPRHNNRNRNRHKYKQNNYTTTEPYLVFPEYSTTITPEYDLSTELGLLASGVSQPPSNRLELYANP